MPSMTMHPPTPADLLDIWDQAAREHSATRRALLLISATCRQPVEVTAGLTVGSRDRMLLGLRECIFGTDLSLQVSCPLCGQAVESSLSTIDLRTPDFDATNLTFEADGHHVAFRLPDSFDLQAIEGTRDLALARQLLLDRCVPNHPVLPPSVVNALIDHMGELDSQADIQLRFECPSCAHAWEAPFDIASFLWTEMQSWGRRMLREVHVLASCYGWSEREIVMLNPSRRQAYLDMVSGE